MLSGRQSTDDIEDGNKDNNSSTLLTESVILTAEVFVVFEKPMILWSANDY